MEFECLILLGGSSKVPSSLELSPDFVIAADSGWRISKEIKMHVDLLIGDLDSLSDDEVSQAKASGTEIKRFPKNKDLTDFELALRHAMEVGVNTITVLGGFGNRIDHSFANLFTLADPSFKKNEATPDCPN